MASTAAATTAAAGAPAAEKKAGGDKSKLSHGGLVIEHEQASGLNVSLHPLVIIEISDHYTRAKVQGSHDAHSKGGIKVIGALLGTQLGRKVEISKSFELVLIPNKGIDHDYLKTKQEQMKKVFPNYEFLGWYSTGSEPTVGDLELHKLFSSYNENPLFFLLDPLQASHSRDLPISLFESELHMYNDTPTTLFAKSAAPKIETVTAERISVDHVAHVSPSGSGDASKLITHMSGLHNAIKMLDMRIKILVNFLEATNRKAIPTDHALLRQIAGLCNQLPAIDSQKFKDEFTYEYNDVLLVTYLASITKATNNINELVDKYNVAYERRGRGRFYP